MTPAIRELFDAAVAAQARSYSPYSQFKVGAAIRTTSGAVYAAPNIENAAYPQSICAEASTIALIDRKSTCLNSSHIPLSRMPSSA